MILLYWNLAAWAKLAIFSDIVFARLILLLMKAFNLSGRLHFGVGLLWVPSGVTSNAGTLATGIAHHIAIN